MALAGESGSKVAVGIMEKRTKGRFPVYVPGLNVNSYLQTVDIFFALNKTPEDEKALEFITSVGQETANRIIGSFKPDKIVNKTFAQIVAKFKVLHEENKNVFAERHRLITRKQEEGESLDDFAIDLQNIVEHCSVGADTEATLVQSVFVAGIRSDKTREAMLRDADHSLNLAKLLEKAKTIEIAASEARKMYKQSVEQVNYVGPMSSTRMKKIVKPGKFVESAGGNQYQKDISSYRGGRDKVSAETVCYNCYNKGHLSYHCTLPKTKKPRYVAQHPRGSSNRKRAFEERINQLSAAMDDLKMSLEDETDSGADQSAEEPTDEEQQSNWMNNVLLGKSDNSKPAFVELNVNGKNLLMECDTGACATICSFNTFKEKFSKCTLLPDKRSFFVISGETVNVVGKINVRVKFQKRVLTLSLLVIKSPKNFVSLLGRDWLNAIWPHWRDAFALNSLHDTNRDRWVNNTVKQLKSDFASVFDDDLTEPIRNVVVDIRIDESAKPIVHKPYTVAFKHREAVSTHLDELEAKGILEKTEYAEWASPIVVVVKPNKKDIRVCMDGSKTVNPHIITHHYPLPVIDELITNKSGAKTFALIDLRGAYQQLVVSEASKRLLVINTHKGLYAYRRLPFGVKPAATIFQSVMDKILQGIPNVQAYIDDILIWAETDEELMKTIKLVLQRLEKHNVKINAEKCKWFVSHVKYLGHILSEAGVSPNPEKVRAITAVSEPKSKTQLKAFLGMITFYTKFIPKLSLILSPMYQLLKKDTKWCWNLACKQAFEKSKNAICSAKVLTHFDPSKPITVTCDASDEGISGILSHTKNDREMPVFFVSRRLSSAEKKYPILHREALAIVFAMEKFYKYVLGQKVSIITDHKPLLGIFNNKKGGPSVIATRLQRYFLRLSIFDFKISHVAGKENPIADCLSRLPVDQDMSSADLEESQRSSFNHLNYLIDDQKVNINSKIIAAASMDDPVLSKVLKFTQNGWPSHVKEKPLKQYYAKRHELDVESGCLIFGERIVVPNSLQLPALQLLHANHRGIQKMKQIARKYLYWEGCGTDIENYVGSCKQCQILGIDRTPRVYGNWPMTKTPFERVHIDFFHKFSRTFLILVDSYSRWIEIRRMTKTDANNVTHELDNIFTNFGFAATIVSDNGPPFNSHGFRKYCEMRNIEHILCPPYHPASNGLAERAVQTTKAVLGKLIKENDSYSSLQIDNEISKFLFHHHQTPTTEDKIIPNERIFSFIPRSHITGLRDRKPTFNDSSQKENKFKINTKVIYTYKANGRAFSTEAKIIKQLSNLTYVIDINGENRKVHKNQLKWVPQKPFVLKNSIRNETGQDLDENSYETTSTKPKKERKYKRKTSTVNQTLRRSTRIYKSKHRNLNLGQLLKKKKS